MNTAPIRNIVIGAGSALLLTFLFMQQRPVDPRQHHRFMNDLNRMKQLDTEINRDLLESRFELLGSYDPFVQKLDEMRESRNRSATYSSICARRRTKTNPAAS